MPVTTLAELRDAMTRDLTTNILPYWLTTARDDERGGFYGEILRDGTVVAGADKGLILNARILWAFSAAYRVLGNAEYRDGADRAYDYLTRHFLDPDGGAYYMVSADGVPTDPKKVTYAQGFTLYAFSEYARATDSEDAKNHARDMFRYIESKCKVDGKYLENAIDSPALPMTDDAPPFDFSSILSMNTYLHIMEPITNFYRIEPTVEVEDSLAAILGTFLDTIVNRDTPHFDLWFGKDWTPLSQTNSYGHDIEGSWLILEAADVLRGNASDRQRAAKLLSRAIPTALAMAQAVLDEGLDPSTGAVYDGGARDGVITEPAKVWWAQAEGVVGFLNAYQSTNDERFLTAALRVWDYIDAQVIDHDGGEWFGTGRDSVDGNESGVKVNAWKCPYHNTRAALEVIERTTAINS
ncbi:MAG: AGE family epimerase/isomerase [Oscillospiraceae bacterium]|jgi:mannobiose 2-epimerase|nr:AGE family epimerase/isomerase [Oscillospiraceae bacterium]